ncbi:MAG: radical SAM/SPASM domain-containing protein [Myxococcales bacterium]|jgi:radical SAM protein with 4Fe4S-binding SPASM domain
MLKRALQEFARKLAPEKIAPEYGFSFELVTSLKQRPRVPRSVDINIHNYCTAKCDMCPMPSLGRKLEKGVMPFSLFERIVDQIVAAGRPTVTFCQNGDVFALPNSIDYLRHACARGLDMYLVTNSAMLNREKVDALVEMGFAGKLYVSFHGIRKATYEKTMGLPFERTLASVNYLLERGLKVQFIRALTHNFEPGEQEEAERYWNRRGVAVTFAPPHSWSGTVREQPPVKETIKGCIQPLNQLCIDFNGDVYLCCIDLMKQVVVGNAKETPLLDIWNGERYLSVVRALFDNSLPQDHMCRKCHAAMV